MKINETNVWNNNKKKINYITKYGRETRPEKMLIDDNKKRIIIIYN